MNEEEEMLAQEWARDPNSTAELLLLAAQHTSHPQTHAEIFLHPNAGPVCGELVQHALQQLDGTAQASFIDAVILDERAGAPHLNAVKIYANSLQQELIASKEAHVPAQPSSPVETPAVPLDTMLATLRHPEHHKAIDSYTLNAFINNAPENDHPAIAQAITDNPDSPAERLIIALHMIRYDPHASEDIQEREIHQIKALMSHKNISSVPIAYFKEQSKGASLFINQEYAKAIAASPNSTEDLLTHALSFAYSIKDYTAIVMHKNADRIRTQLATQAMVTMDYTHRLSFIDQVISHPDASRPLLEVMLYSSNASQTEVINFRRLAADQKSDQINDVILSGSNNEELLRQMFLHTSDDTQIVGLMNHVEPLMRDETLCITGRKVNRFLENASPEKVTKVAHALIDHLHKDPARPLIRQCKLSVTHLLLSQADTNQTRKILTGNIPLLLMTPQEINLLFEQSSSEKRAVMSSIFLASNNHKFHAVAFLHATEEDKETFIERLFDAPPLDERNNVCTSIGEVLHLTNGPQTAILLVSPQATIPAEGYMDCQTNIDAGQLNRAYCLAWHAAQQGDHDAAMKQDTIYHYALTYSKLDELHFNSPDISYMSNRHLSGPYLDKFLDMEKTLGKNDPNWRFHTAHKKKLYEAKTLSPAHRMLLLISTPEEETRHWTIGENSRIYANNMRKMMAERPALTFGHLKTLITSPGVTGYFTAIHAKPSADLGNGEKAIEHAMWSYLTNAPKAELDSLKRSYQMIMRERVPSPSRQLKRPHSEISL